MMKVLVFTCCSNLDSSLEIRKKAKIRNPYNQIPHLTQGVAALSGPILSWRLIMK